MTRALSVANDAAIIQTITEPGYLVEINFPTILRQSSRGEVDVAGKVFVAGRFNVLPIESDAVTMTARVVFDDVDFAVATLLMLYGVVDRTVSIWKFYGDAPTQLDLIPLFSGRGHAAAGETEHYQVTIEAVSKGGRTEYAPRDYITPANGFHFVPAAGTIVTFGGQKYVLESGQ